MFCTHCAALNPPTAVRCNHCGLLLNRDVRAHGPMSKRRNWLLALPLLVVLATMVIIGWQAWTAHQDRASAYDRAVAALATGDLSNAIVWFGRAGNYRDAPAQRVTAQQRLDVAQSILLDAQSALDRGDDRLAVELLRQLVAEFPDDPRAVDLLATAEGRFRADLVRAISLATASQAWLDAERGTLQLAYWDGVAPDSDALASMRLHHAPILIVRNGALMRAGPDLAGERILFDAHPVAQPEWNPDRSRISFFAQHTPNDQLGTLLLIDPNGGQAISVDENALISTVAWNPDGNELAYTAPAPSGTDASGTVLRLFDCSTGTTRTLAPPPGFARLESPTWSGDGEQFAIIASKPGGTAAILIVDRETLESHPLSIAVPPNLRAVRWSPTAHLLLLWESTGLSEQNPANFSAISLLNLDDQSITPVTPSTQAPSRPVWAPDGRQFAFLDHGTTLHVRIRDGIGERTLGLPTPGDGDLSWAPGGVGILIPPLDTSGPPMLVSIGDRLGPAMPLSVSLGKTTTITAARWGPATEPLPDRYDPLRAPQ